MNGVVIIDFIGMYSKQISWSYYILLTAYEYRLVQNPKLYSSLNQKVELTRKCKRQRLEELYPRINEKSGRLFDSGKFNYNDFGSTSDSYLEIQLIANKNTRCLYF